MHINGLIFIAPVSHDIFYQASHFIPNKNKQIILNTIKELFELYKKNNFKITKIYCDNELYDGLKIFNSNKIEIISPPAQAHVSKPERNIHTIKEQVRTNIYNLPYQSLPRTVLKYLLNYFPAMYHNILAQEQYY